MTNRKRRIVIIFCSIAFIFLTAFAYLARRPADFAPQVRWGLAFSRLWAEDLGLDQRATYSAILSDLRPTSLRLPLYWHDIEAERGKYDFRDYDWMIGEAEKSGTELTLTLGGKLPRWPECHDPYWATGLTAGEREGALFALVAAAVERYKDLPALTAWQVENEPFLPFGECPAVRAGFLEREITLVRSLDHAHPIVITDSGELGLWLRAASYGDIFGTTMYRVIWNDRFGYIHYPLPPRFFWLKENLLRLFYPQKKIIVSEMQGEPWGPKMIYETPLDEQYRSMSLAQFRDNINYARDVGIRDTYLWGAEWWYWLKVKHNEPAFWNEAKLLTEGSK